MRPIFIALLSITLFTSCKKESNTVEPAPSSSLYFPPVGGNGWEATSALSLGWNTLKIPALQDYLEANNTRAFIVLKDGKIVLENYWGNTIIGAASFNQNSNWY